ncbi:MAG: Ribonuclease P protein component [Chlamydiia bacterium]|nr:Ribonuclease P protein component [Chlamydiia bacterium]MCH9624722.1 Ribonuclease P protein component [Chlamydiia bacterium]
MNYEKNIPTKQDQKKALTRIPCQNGDQGWTSCPCPQKTERQTPINGVKLPFLKGMHVRKKWEFGKIRRVGKKYYGKHICFQYIFEPGNLPKIGLTVSKKYGGAVQRNLFKRRIKEIFRTSVPTFPLPVTINILPLRTGKTASFEQLEADWANFIIYLKKGLEDEKQVECTTTQSLHDH